MDYSMSAKRHMEHPHDIKAHGPRVERLGCASVCSLQQHVLPWGGNNHNKNHQKTRATTNIYITFCTCKLLSLAFLSYLDLIAAWWDRCMGIVVSIYEGVI